MIHKQSYDQVLDTIITSDPRYHRDAYHFVREGLDYTQQTISKHEDGTVRHITGQELLAGMRANALEEYGPMALLVLNEWGVSRCEDFGEIVFNMVEKHLGYLEDVVGQLAIRAGTVREHSIELRLRDLC